MHLTLINNSYQKIDDMNFIFIFTDLKSKFSRKKLREFFILDVGSNIYIYIYIYIYTKSY